MSLAVDSVVRNAICNLTTARRTLDLLAPLEELVDQAALVCALLADFIFVILKNIPCVRRLARYYSETEGSLTKKRLRLCLQTVSSTSHATKNRV